MILLINKIRKIAMHLFLLAICFVMVAGIASCRNEPAVTPENVPVDRDDASLLKWQLEKFINTRAIPYNVALVTTKTSFNFSYLSCTGSITIDWGDGTIDRHDNSTAWGDGTSLIDKSHTYIDGLPAHTIFIYGNFEGHPNYNRLDVHNQEIIFADISGAPDLYAFEIMNNRLTNIDLSKNSGLSYTNLTDNNLYSIDVSDNLNLASLFIANSPIKEINVTMLPELELLDVRGTLISVLDISHNSKLFSINIGNTSLSDVDLSTAPGLKEFLCYNSKISNLDLSQNPLITWLNCSRTSIKRLDLSNNPKLYKLACPECSISNIVFNDTINDLAFLEISNNPIEQSSRQMTSLVMALPDRNIPNIHGDTIGVFRTNTSYINIIEPMLTEYNWSINPVENGWLSGSLNIQQQTAKDFRKSAIY